MQSFSSAPKKKFKKGLFWQGTAKQKQASKTYHAYKLRYNRVNCFIAKDITMQGCLRTKKKYSEIRFLKQVKISLKLNYSVFRIPWQTLSTENLIQLHLGHYAPVVVSTGEQQISQQKEEHCGRGSSQVNTGDTELKACDAVELNSI